MDSSEEIRTGALEPRGKRSALTATAPPPDPKGSGRRWRMSRSLPRGRLKASALVLPRVLNSPATLRNQGGWFCFRDDDPKI
jgi:hypothetical protein